MSSDQPDLPDDNDASPEETSSPAATQDPPSAAPTRDAGPAVESGARSQSEQRPGGSSVSVDQRLVDQTKQQIRNLVREIAQLAQSDANVGDFYEGFLGRVVSALAAEGGAIWILSDDDRLELQYQINLKNTGLHDGEEDQARHGLLLKKVLAGGQPMMIAPHAGAPGDEEAANPTDFLLLLGAVHIEKEARGIVEIFQRPGAGPTTQRGYLRFLVEMCDLIGEFLKNRRLRQFRDRESLWGQLESFISNVHQGLDLRQTAFTVANEGRRLILCDRVSIALPHGNKFRVEAVSGEDTIDRRSTTIRDLSQLATAVVATRDPLWYTGSCDDMPPQIEETLQAYVDQSHAKLVVVQPLLPPDDEARKDPEEARDQPPARIVGALIVERFDDDRVDDALQERLRIVSQHSGSALANAHEHHSLFLMPLWRALGRSRWLIQARTLPKTILALLALLAVSVALVVVPWKFELKASGILQPEIRSEIFAHVSGVVQNVDARHGKQVKANETLVELRNTDMELAIEQLRGQLEENGKRMSNVERMLSDARRLRPEEYDRLSGDLETLRETKRSIDTQLQLYQKKEEDLIVTSPIDGQVVTWEVRDNLIHRPVMMGQVLMNIVEPAGPWELEVYMPESRMGQVSARWKELQAKDEDLTVTYMLATHPGNKFTGTVAEIHRRADVRGEHGNTVLLRVKVNKDDLPELLPESKVTAKVDCGWRPVGYVIMYDLITFVQAKVLFFF